MEYKRPYGALLLAGALFALVTGTRAQSTPLNTQGTVFWSGFMQNAYGAQTLKLQITSATSTSGTASIPGTGWSQAFSVPAGGFTSVTVPATAEHTGSETINDLGVLVTADDPVSVVALSQQSFTADGTLLLPFEALGTQYMAEGYLGLPGFNDFYKSELLIVSTADDTEVEITPSVNTAGGHPAGVPFTVQLDQGQTYQVQSALATLDITGTTVIGTAASGDCRPFAVFSGSMCANVPVGCPACDHVFEQLYPTDRWGASFVALPLANTTGYTLRVQALLNNTTVSFNGAPPVTLNAGDRHELNNVTSATCVGSNGPISVVQLMEGYNCAGDGDPSMLVLQPVDRKATHAIFHTPTSPQIGQRRVNVLMEGTSTSTLQLDGFGVNQGSFTALPACPDLAFAQLSLSPGVHTLSSASGFIAQVYGTGTGESYLFGLGSFAPEVVEPDSVICSSGPVSLSSPIILDNAFWTLASDPNTVLAQGQSITFTPVGSDTLTVHGELPVSGCPKTFDFILGAPVPPSLTLSANDLPNLSICQFSPVQLAVDPPLDPAFYELAWSPAGLVSDPQAPDPTAWPFTDTWFKLAVTSTAGCGSITDSILVQVTPGEVASFEAVAQDTLLCLGESVVLEGRVERVMALDHLDTTPGAVFANVQNGTIGNACGSVTGAALYFDGNGQRAARTVPFDLSNGGQVRFSLKIATGTAPCDDADPGEDVVLEYSTNGGGNWTVFSTLNEASFPLFTPVTVAVPPAAHTPATLFRWRQVAHSGAGQDNWVLDEVYLTTYDGSGLNYAWSPTAGLGTPNAQQTTAAATTSGWVQVTLTDPNTLCTYTDSVYLTVDPAFTLTVTPDTTVCDAAGIPLEAMASSGSGITWNWTPNNGTLSATNVPDPVASPTNTTTYTVNAENASGCTATEAVTITVGTLIGVNVTASDLQLCQGETSQLNAAVQGNTNTILSWTGAGLSSTTQPDPVASPTTNTTYVATLVDTLSGCTVQDSITIAVSTAYSLTLPADTTLCNTLGFQLSVQHNVPGPFTISWSPAGFLNNASIAAPTIMADTTATYVVVVTDANGCSVTDSVTVTDAFDTLVSPVALQTCQGNSLLLDAGFPGSTYSWNTNQTTQTITVNASGAYTVTITDPQGCQTYKTFNVTVHPLPVVDLGADTLICGTASLVLDANSPGNTLLWSTNATTPTITVNQPGAYWVTATSPQGCVNSDTVIVDFQPLPVDMLVDVTACATQPPLLDAGNPGSTFLWNTNATTQTIIATTDGTYSVTVTTPSGCSDTFDATVTLVPEPVVDLGPDTALCAGQPLVLDAGNPGLGHLWSTNATSQTITATTSGVYWVEVDNGSCIATDSIDVVLHPLPVDMLMDVTVCEDQPAMLDAGNPGGSYLWSTNATSQTIAVNASGTYTVTVTTPQQCSATFDAVVDLVPYPVVDLGPDTVLCDGDVLVLDAGNPGATYTWSSGQNTRTINVTQAGTYSVEVANGSCTTSDAVTAQFNPSPARMAAQQFYTCLDEEPHYVVLDAGNPGSDFDWSTGETTQIILAGAYGWFYVEITNDFDCSVTDSVVVNEFCPANIFVPNTFTPNGDGTNDFWMPVGNNLAEIELQVFDRWGGIVFQTNVVGDAWDGRVGGEFVKNDTYIWKMSYRFFTDAQGQLGPMREEMGHVQVLR